MFNNCLSEQALIRSICQFPWCKYSNHLLRQGTNLSRNWEEITQLVFVNCYRLAIAYYSGHFVVVAFALVDPQYIKGASSKQEEAVYFIHCNTWMLALRGLSGSPSTWAQLRTTSLQPFCGHISWCPFYFLSDSSALLPGDDTADWVLTKQKYIAAWTSAVLQRRIFKM